MRGVPRVLLAAAVLAVVAVAAACKDDAAPAAQTAAQAQPFGKSSCAMCGMIVAEQSSPRGQIVHRDTHKHFCALSDMLSYLEAPSPHGAVVGLFVETLDPAADPATFDPGPRPWIPAERAFYVLGIRKPRVMGVPIVAYPSRADAQAVAAKHPGAKIHDWKSLVPNWRIARDSAKQSH